MSISRINSFLSSYLLFFILIALTGGLFLGDTLVRFSFILPYLLMYMVFVMGTSCTLESLVSIARSPKSFIIGIIVIYLIMPFVGFLMGRVFYPDDTAYAVGLFLVAVSPVAISSMIWTGFSRANIVLALSLVTVATLVSGFSISLQMYLFMGKTVDFDAAKLTINLVKMIVVPVLLGILLRQFAPGVVKKASPGMSLSTKFTMIAILAVNGSAVSPYFMGVDWEFIRLFLIVALYLIINFGIALLIAIPFLGLHSDDLPAVVFASAMKNNSAGIVVALAYFGARVALPVIVCIFLQHMYAGIFHRVLQSLRSRSGTVL